MRFIARACCVGVVAGLAAAGCVPLVVGAGMGLAGYQYNEGELQYAVNANVDKTYKAVDAVIKERQWEVKETTRDVTTAYFRCNTQEGAHVQIDVSRRSADFTRVAVRYGTWGDEAKSRKFIEQVKARL